MILTEEGALQSPVDNRKKRRRKIGWAFLVVFIILAAGALAVWRLHLYRPIWNWYNQATLTIKITDPASVALAGVSIQINGTTYHTDAHGAALLTVTGGQYTANLAKAGFVTTAKTLTLHRGDNGLQIYSIQKDATPTYAVKGFIQDYITGLPLTNVQVVLGSASVLTDPSGAYVFANQLSGPVKLTLSKAGYASQELDVTVEKADVVTAKIPLVPSGKVVFVSNRDGTRKLYTSSYDGSSQQLLVANQSAGESFAPFLSPDSKQVAYSSTQAGVKDAYGNTLANLYVTSIGTPKAQLVGNDVSPSFIPLWSPDSRYIYYSGYTDATQNTGTDRVYDTQKGTSVDIGESAGGLVFSPDGTTVAYATSGVSTDGTNVSLAKTLNLVTGQRTTVSTRDQFISNLRFSADGKTLSYEVIVNNVRQRYQDNLDGSNEQTVPVLDNVSRQVVLSPDGASQAYIEQRDGQTDLYVADKAGDNEKRLTTLGILNIQILPHWDPGGLYLTFAVHKDGEDALYVVGANGGDPHKIVDMYAD